ncbi:MAG: hypothetical protein JWP25_2032 [Bradyrhizobium sp.]|nr:hypothetical protein [Bradyrhizobium sp.]
MSDPNAPVAPAAKALVVPASNPPAVAPASLAIDERFAALAADFMSQVDAKLDHGSVDPGRLAKIESKFRFF